MSSRRAEDLALTLLLLVPASVFLVQAVGWSFAWRSVHDAPIMMYLALLMDRFGAVPHRDFFDMNVPGAHLVYWAIGRLLGSSDAALRAADLGALAGVGGISAFALRRCGWRAMWAAPVLISIAYLHRGAEASLQREPLLLLPAAAGFAAATLGPRVSASWRAFAVGLGFGVAAAIKPQALIGLPAAWGLLCFEVRSEDGPGIGRRALFAGAVGAALPWTLLCVWLAAHGALFAFLDTAWNYLPLYAAIGGWRIVLTPDARIDFIVGHFFGLGGMQVAVAIATLGIASCLLDGALPPAVRRLAGGVAALAVSLWLYPLLAGSFFPYHWIPLQWALMLAAALGFTAHPEASAAWKRALGFAAAAAVVVWLVAPGTDQAERYARGAAPPKEGRVDAMAAWLSEHLEPGDTVQPIDWAGTGVAHAMLLAEAPLATSFVYAFHFEHHVSTPTIQGLRRRFLSEIDESRPRFVVEGRVRRPFVRGVDTEPRFEAFESWLRANYRPVARGPGWVVWERSGGPGRVSPGGSSSAGPGAARAPRS